MARMKDDAIRSGPTAVTASATQTAGSWALATLMIGNANSDVVYVEVLAACLSTGAANYSALVKLTVAVGLAAGPTYSLGAVSYSQLNAGSGNTPSDLTGGGMWDSMTLDQSGGNLRLRVTFGTHTQPFTCYAIATTIGP
jgi:hypothetical protein